MSDNHVLIVHPDASARALLKAMLQGLGCRIAEATGYHAGVQMLERDPDALVLAGADRADPKVAEFLASVRRNHPGVALLLVLSGAAAELANPALRYGVASVLKFPLPTHQMRAAVVHALSLRDRDWPAGYRPPVSTPPTPRPREDPAGPPVSAPPAPRPREDLTAGETPRAAGQSAFPSPGIRSETETPIRPLKVALAEPEKQLILSALQARNWDTLEAAVVLEIDRSTLYKKMKKYGLRRPISPKFGARARP